MITNIKYTAYCSILLVVLSGCAGSLGSQHYINTSRISADFLTTPAREHSKAWDKEISAVLEAQTHTTARDRKEILEEGHGKIEHVARVLGADFSQERLPKTYAMLDTIDHDCHTVNGMAKEFWHTERPYVADKRVKPLLPPVPNDSYPSGHTTCSRVLAEILGQLVPQKRDELRQRAAAIAQHRVIAGMHYPQDLRGGEQLAFLIIGALQQSSAYQHDFAEAQAEIKTHGTK